MGVNQRTDRYTVRWSSTLAGRFVVFVLVVVCGMLPAARVVRGELFTAFVDLERLLEGEKLVANDLRQYVAREEQRLQKLLRLADDMERHSMEALVDPERHLGNPVNAYLLIKRFTVDWERVVDADIRGNETNEFLANLSSKVAAFATKEDLNGAAEALLRLQDTYALTTEQIARGDLMGAQESPQMTAHDCFQLGLVAHHKQDYYHAVLWLTEALRIYDTETVKTVDRATLLDYAAYSLYRQGNLRHALSLTNEWLQIDPNHTRAQNNRVYYKKTIEEEVAKSGAATDSIDYSPHGDPVNRRPLDSYKSSDEFQKYERLCRGDEVIVHPWKDELTCRYMRHHPMFYIRPVKVELLHLNPPVSMFHNILTSAEMATVRKMARPRLKRSLVGPTETSTAPNYRISKSAWLSDGENPLITRISQKAGAIANLTLESAEQMQVLNYGIGGHYEPHYDFSTRKELTTLEEKHGHRIATFLCYITNVTAGGATVFPQLGLQLWPEQGSCVLWYNLQRNGDGDFTTRHAACPVLSGTKWDSGEDLGRNTTTAMFTSLSTLCYTSMTLLHVALELV